MLWTQVRVFWNPPWTAWPAVWNPRLTARPASLIPWPTGPCWAQAAQPQASRRGGRARPSPCGDPASSRRRPPRSLAVVVASPSGESRIRPRSASGRRRIRGSGRALGPRADRRDVASERFRPGPSPPGSCRELSPVWCRSRSAGRRSVPGSEPLRPSTGVEPSWKIVGRGRGPTSDRRLSPSTAGSAALSVPMDAEPSRANPADPG